MPRSRRTRRLTLLVLVLVSVTFLTVDFRMNDSSPFTAVRDGLTDVITPLQTAAAGATAPVGRLAGRLHGLTDAEDRERRLQRENARLRQQLHDAVLDRATADQLRRLQLLAGAGGYRVVPGRVVALGGSDGLEWTVTVDLGTRDGVREGMTVVNGDGLVGRVKRAGRSASVVLLAIDPISAVGSRLESGHELGLCKGAGLHPLRFQLLDTQAPMAVGDRVMTGPYGETTYAPGVPVGVVSRVVGTQGSLVRLADVHPYVDFTALDVIGVVVAPPRTDPREAVLPPKPAAASPGVG